MNEMSMDIENIIEWLRYEEPNIYAVGIIGTDGSIVMQTENWDLSNELETINQLIYYYEKIPSIEIAGVKYSIVENTPERKIGTNVPGQGHIIICPVPVGGTGALICYISPEIGPRDALLLIQKYAKNLENLI